MKSCGPQLYEDDFSSIFEGQSYWGGCLHFGLIFLELSLVKQWELSESVIQTGRNQLTATPPLPQTNKKKSSHLKVL